jgi:hypothetical protein
VSGLGGGLADGLARWGPGRAVHDLGKIIGDLDVAVAPGGDYLADIAVWRAKPELHGPVASDPVVSPTVAALAADPAPAVKAIRAARAAARERVWALTGPAARGAVVVGTLASACHHPGVRSRRRGRWLAAGRG